MLSLGGPGVGRAAGKLVSQPVVHLPIDSPITPLSLSPHHPTSLRATSLHPHPTRTCAACETATQTMRIKLSEPEYLAPEEWVQLQFNFTNKRTYYKTSLADQGRSHACPPLRVWLHSR